jgi:hypothetical protein
MYLKPNPKEISVILHILKGAQFEFLPRAPFYIDTPLCISFIAAKLTLRALTARQEILCI